MMTALRDEAHGNRIVLLRFRGEPWIRAKLRRTTPPKRCALGWEVLEPGTEAWRPASNPVFRSDRICDACVEDALADRWEAIHSRAEKGRREVEEGEDGRRESD